MEGKKIKDRIILKIFAIAFSILFFIVTVNTILLNKTIQINFNVVVITIGTFFSYLIIYGIYKILEKHKKFLKISTPYKIIIGSVIFAIQMFIANLIYAHCGWDCGGVIDNAFSLYKGIGIDATYFAVYPNNLAVLLLFKYLYVVVGLFQNVNDSNMYWITVVFNIIMLDIAAIFTILTAKKILGNKTTYLTVVFIFPLILFTPFIIVPYTDTLTLFIPIAIFYFYLKIKDNTKLQYLYVFIEAILLVGGYFLKPTCVIIGIAILLAEFLYINVKKETIYSHLKQLGIVLVILVIGTYSVLVAYNYLKDTNISKYISMKEFEEKSIPATHFLMMGMKEGKISDARGKNNTMFGGYDGEDYNNTTRIKGKEEKIKYHLAIIKERLQNFGIYGYMKFVYNKVIWILSDGTFYYGAEGTFFITQPYNQSRIAKKIQGFINISSKKYQYITANIMQIVWVDLLIGIIFTYKNREKKINILKFSIIGIILFIVLFEGRARYLYNYIPMFIIVGTLGIKNIITKIEGKLRNKKEIEHGKKESITCNTNVL